MQPVKLELQGLQNSGLGSWMFMLRVEPLSALDCSWQALGKESKGAQQYERTWDSPPGSVPH